VAGGNGFDCPTGSVSVDTATAPDGHPRACGGPTPMEGSTVVLEPMEMIRPLSATCWPAFCTSPPVGARLSRAGRPGQAGTGPGDVGRGYVPACISQGPPSVSLSSRVVILSVALRRASRSLGPRTSMNSSRTRLTCPGAASAWWANPASVRIAKV